MSKIFSENRTKNYIIQLKGSFIFKILAVLASFLTIPMMVNYLGKEIYGVWSTMLAVLSWVVLFDIGIGSGLRNKISESLAKNDIQGVKKFISTAYTLIGMVSLVLIVIFLTISEFIPWQKIFNTSALSNSELGRTINVTAIFLFLNFWISLINQVFNGYQKTSLVVFNQFLSNVLSLLMVFVLYNYFDSSLLLLAIVYGSALLISNLFLTLWFYYNRMEIVPSITNFTYSCVKSIGSLSSRFFIIQVAVVIIFTTDKIIITQLLGSQYVTSYDVVFKLFSIITIFHGIIISPLWASYSDAYHRSDLNWIRRTIHNQLKIYFVIVIATIVLAFLSQWIIELWIGCDFEVDSMLIIMMSGFILISVWNNIFAFFLNATDNLNVQINTSIIAMIINVPLSILLVKYFGMTAYGVVLATCISLSFFAFFGSKQALNIINKETIDE